MHDSGRGAAFFTSWDWSSVTFGFMVGAGVHDPDQCECPGTHSYTATLSVNLAWLYVELRVFL